MHSIISTFVGFPKRSIVCHCYQAMGGPSLLDAEGGILPCFKEARGRGVLFDSAIARSNHNISVMQGAFAKGFFPDLVGTDIVERSVYRNTVFSLPYVMSKHVALGMPLNEVIRACTETAAGVMKMPHRLGTLAPDADADAAVLKIREHPVVFNDMFGNSVTGNLLLVPQASIKAGRVVYKQIDFEAYT